MSPLNGFTYYLVSTNPTLDKDMWPSRLSAKKVMFGDNSNPGSKTFLSATLWAKETVAIKSDLLNKQKKIIIGNYLKSTWNLKFQYLMEKLGHIQKVLWSVGIARQWQTIFIIKNYQTYTCRGLYVQKYFIENANNRKIGDYWLMSTSKNILY